MTIFGSKWQFLDQNDDFWSKFRSKRQLLDEKDSNTQNDPVQIKMKIVGSNDNLDQN